MTSHNIQLLRWVVHKILIKFVGVNMFQIIFLDDCHSPSHHTPYRSWSHLVVFIFSLNPQSCLFPPPERPHDASRKTVRSTVEIPRIVCIWASHLFSTISNSQKGLYNPDKLDNDSLQWWYWLPSHRVFCTWKDKLYKDFPVPHHTWSDTKLLRVPKWGEKARFHRWSTNQEEDSSSHLSDPQRSCHLPCQNECFSKRKLWFPSKKTQNRQTSWFNFLRSWSMFKPKDENPSLQPFWTYWCLLRPRVQWNYDSQNKPSRGWSMPILQGDNFLKVWC